jgi:hypothetical protein
MPPTSIPGCSRGSAAIAAGSSTSRRPRAPGSNAVETFFSALTRRRIRRGRFHSIVDLQAAINRYIAEHNHDPRPFTWTKPADQILTNLNRLNASVH